MINVLKDWSVSIILILIVIIIGLVVLLSSNGVIGFGSGSAKKDSITMGDIVLMEQGKDSLQKQQQTMKAKNNKGQVSKNPATSTEVKEKESNDKVDVRFVVENAKGSHQVQLRLLDSETIEEIVIKVPTDDIGSFQLVTVNVDDIRDSFNESGTACPALTTNKSAHPCPAVTTNKSAHPCPAVTTDQSAHPCPAVTTDQYEDTNSEDGILHSHSHSHSHELDEKRKDYLSHDHSWGDFLEDDLLEDDEND